MEKGQKTTVIVAQTALFAALCYIGFQFLRIDISLPGGKTAMHMGNAFCVLAALLTSGVQGGVAGALGMGIADLTSGYVSTMPQTLIMKFLIGFIVGTVAHKAGHVNARETAGQRILWSVIGAASGMLFNVLVDPVLSYLRKHYLLGMEQEVADILSKWSALSTLVNAVLAVLIAGLLYNMLVVPLKKRGLIQKD